MLLLPHPNHPWLYLTHTLSFQTTLNCILPRNNAPCLTTLSCTVYTPNHNPGLAVVPGQQGWHVISSGIARDPFLSVTPPPLITPACLGERRGVPLPTAQRCACEAGTPHPKVSWKNKIIIQRNRSYLRAHTHNTCTPVP